MTVGSQIKRLGSETLIYGISGTLSRLITIFLVPFYARAFPPSEYGYINIVNAMIALLSSFIVLGLDSASARWYYDTEDRDRRQREPGDRQHVHDPQVARQRRVVAKGTVDAALTPAREQDHEDPEQAEAGAEGGERHVLALDQCRDQAPDGERQAERAESRAKPREVGPLGGEVGPSRG